MKSPVPSKIHCPQTRNAVLRPRLFDRLDALRGSRVVWVCGSGGAGKTTLAGSYIAECTLDHLWYQLDAGEADLATFFQYLGLAIRQASPRMRVSLPALTPEYLPGLPTVTRRYVETIATVITKPFVVVLDNYELVPHGALLHQVLRDAAGCLPPGSCFLVLSREEPPPAFSRLRLHGELTVLNGEDLCLTLEEGQRLAADLAPASTNSPDAAQVEDLLERTRGWVAGFLLLLWQGESDAQNPGPGITQSPQLLFDYFAAELFDTLPTATQRILLIVALLPVATARDATLLTGDNQAGQVLHDLLRRNCFLTRRGHDEPAYELHPLFRQFLLRRSQETIPPGERLELGQRAATLLEGAGQFAAAASLYRANESWGRLAELAMREAPGLLASGRHQTLIEWLDCLPDEIFDSSPWLTYWCGFAKAPLAPASARGDYEHAYARFRDANDPVGLYLTWAGIMDTFFFEWSDFRPVDRWIAEMEWLRERHPFPSVDIELRTYSALGTILFRCPTHRFWREWIEQGEKCLHQAQDRGLALYVGGWLVGALAIQGDFRRSLTLLEQLRPLGQDQDLPPLFRIFWFLNGAVACSRCGEIDQAVIHAQEGLALAQQTGLYCWDTLLYACVAMGHLIYGRLDLVDPALRGMRRALSAGSQNQLSMYEFLLACAAYQRGEQSLALAHAKAARDLSSAAGTPFPETLFHGVILGPLLFEVGECELATKHLRIIRQIGQAMNSRSIEAVCAMTEAKAALDRGDHERCRERLAQALSLSHPTGDTTWAIIGPKRMARLYNEALLAGIEVEQVCGLIRRCRVLPEDPATAAPAWPWPVKIFTLGRVSVLRDGASVALDHKPRDKPLELLWVLLAQGGRDVCQES